MTFRVFTWDQVSEVWTMYTILQLHTRRASVTVPALGDVGFLIQISRVIAKFHLFLYPDY